MDWPEEANVRENSSIGTGPPIGQGNTERLGTIASMGGTRLPVSSYRIVLFPMLRICIGICRRLDGKATGREGGCSCSRMWSCGGQKQMPAKPYLIIA
jgi:hypothetical protein